MPCCCPFSSHFPAQKNSCLEEQCSTTGAWTPCILPGRPCWPSSRFHARTHKVMNRNIPPKKRGTDVLKLGMRASKKSSQKEGSSDVLRNTLVPPNTLLPMSQHCCPECAKAFASPGKLQQHMYVHTGERPFKCPECAKGFSSRFKLMRHALIHSNERRYKCTYCERCFHRKDHLKNHMQVHNPNKKVYKCDQCVKEYNSRLSFRKHVAIHAAEAGDLECKVCGKLFATTEEIMYHLKVHTGSRAVKSPNEKKFKCEFCERRFFTRKDVKRHLVVHTGRRDFLCQFCPQRFGRKDHLVRHIKKSHSTPKSKEDIEDLNASTDYGPPYSSYAAPPAFAPPSTSDLMHFSHSALPHHCHMHQVPPNQPLLQRQFKKELEHMFQPPLTVAPHPAPYSSSSSNMYLLSPSASDHNHEFKMYEDIKTEREDVLVDQFNPSLDINQLLGYLPYTSAATSAAMSPPLSTSPNGPLDGNPMPLPQFNQAFQ